MRPITPDDHPTAVRGGSVRTDKPNILVIWGDDIGWSNISAYNRYDGLPDAQYRPHRQRGCPVHPRLRPAKLHGRPRSFILGQHPFQAVNHRHARV